MHADRIFNLVHRGARLYPMSSGARLSRLNRPDVVATGRFIIDEPALRVSRTPGVNPAGRHREGLALPSNPTWFEFSSRTGNTRLAAHVAAYEGRDAARQANTIGEAVWRQLVDRPEMTAGDLRVLVVRTLVSPTDSDIVLVSGAAQMIFLDQCDSFLGQRTFVLSSQHEPSATELRAIRDVTAAALDAIWLINHGGADMTFVHDGLPATMVTTSNAERVDGDLVRAIGRP